MKDVSIVEVHIHSMSLPAESKELFFDTNTNIANFISILMVIFLSTDKPLQKEKTYP